MKYSRVSMIVAVLAFSLGCDSAPNMSDIVSMGKAADTMIRIKRIPMRMLLTAGVASMSVLVEELSNLGIDSQELLDQVVESDKTIEGLPPGDIATVMLVHKETNTVRFWHLKENVKSISLNTADSDAVELKVINEEPLRVELWIDGNMDHLDVTVEMKN